MKYFVPKRPQPLEVGVASKQAYSFALIVIVVDLTELRLNSSESDCDDRQPCAGHEGDANVNFQ